ncbi:substrate-binding domain-containing protein [Pseudomonadota bacterium]
MSKRLLTRVIGVLSVSTMFLFINGVEAQQRLRMATTTSTDNSGLLKQLNPVFEKKNKVTMDVIAVGTGKALKLGENGDVDIVFVHAPEAEKKFVAAGYGVKRWSVMHNDFVILGPTSDPVKLNKQNSAIAAFKLINEKGATFVSRGDQSGTHKKEQILWRRASIVPLGKWYLSTGQGMGAVLQIADEKQAYTLSDRGTYIAYLNKVNLKVLGEKDPLLFNPYHIIAVDPKRHPHVKFDLATKYIEFVRGKQGQQIIDNFRLQGMRLFHADVVLSK